MLVLRVPMLVPMQVGRLDHLDQSLPRQHLIITVNVGEEVEV